MVSLFTNALEQVGQLHKTDDDLIDRLNHRFTVVLLVAFTTFVSAKQFIGEPISCWSPAQFTGSQVAYTNSICWLKGTYYLENDRRDIPHRTQNSEFRIAYYQFVPYMLLVMAILFYFPHMLWRNMSRHLGFDLRSIIQGIKNVSSGPSGPDSKNSSKTSKKDDKSGNEGEGKKDQTGGKPEKGIHQIALQIHISLEYNSSKYVIDRHKYLNRLLEICQCSYQYRNHLSLLYIFIKILYLINCLCQFYFLSIFFSFPFHTFGIEWLLITLKKLHYRTNNQSNETKWFPRVVMCDFMVRQLGSNQHWIAVQCNLPINLFNELIFLIIWAWLIFLSSLTCISLILCLISIYTRIGHRFLRKYLYMSLPELNKREEEEFIEKYLRWDGILVLRILAQNTNDIIMSNLVSVLFQIHSTSIKNEDNSDEQIQSSGHYMRIDSSSI